MQWNNFCSIYHRTAASWWVLQKYCTIIITTFLTIQLQVVKRVKFSLLWQWIFRLMNCLYSNHHAQITIIVMLLWYVVEKLQVLTISMCTLYCHHKNTQIVVLTIVSIRFQWGWPTQLKVRWSTAVMDCGGLSVTPRVWYKITGEVICRQLGHKHSFSWLKFSFSSYRKLRQLILSWTCLPTLLSAKNGGNH